MTATKPRTEWYDADHKLITYPSRVWAIFMDGPHAGWNWVDCRVDHPPKDVEHHGTKYLRDDDASKLTYWMVTDGD